MPIIEKSFGDRTAMTQQLATEETAAGFDPPQDCSVTERID
jgi:hypothetical protein